MRGLLLRCGPLLGLWASLQLLGKSIAIRELFAMSISRLLALKIDHHAATVH